MCVDERMYVCTVVACGMGTDVGMAVVSSFSCGVGTILELNNGKPDGKALWWVILMAMNLVRMTGQHRDSCWGNLLVWMMVLYLELMMVCIERNYIIVLLDVRNSVMMVLYMEWMMVSWLVVCWDVLKVLLGVSKFVC